MNEIYETFNQWLNIEYNMVKREYKAAPPHVKVMLRNKYADWCQKNGYSVKLKSNSTVKSERELKGNENNNEHFKARGKRMY